MNWMRRKDRYWPSDYILGDTDVGCNQCDYGRMWCGERMAYMIVKGRLGVYHIPTLECDYCGHWEEGSPEWDDEELKERLCLGGRPLIEREIRIAEKWLKLRFKIWLCGAGNLYPKGHI